MRELIVFSGSAGKALAEKISTHLKVPPGEALVGQFSDGETRVELQRNVRGRDVFIVQSLCAPANHNLMEAAILVDACKRASARHITLVAPYFAYARQDRKSASRTPITAKLVAKIMETAGIHRLLSFELHNSAIQGFFDIPVDHLFAKRIFTDYFTSMGGVDTLVVSPDAGGVERARAVAKQMNSGLAIVDKRRDRPNESKVMHVIGDVRDKRCLIVDDIIDTAGSIVQAAEALAQQGALEVHAAVSHPVLSGLAVERIEASSLASLVVTDSIPLNAKAQACPKIVQLSISELLAQAITRIYNYDSVSSLFL
ncbi:MAG: ribose-phosphate pyrophosphokinase [Oligoflexales bacterium]|nr:ribose-phosphate pyrophosphokinase [Oligoflexales bacterium]